MRAVAEKGAELIEGPHESPHIRGPAITIKQVNGFAREIPFDEEARATPVLIEAMILDLGIEDTKIREATKKHCLTFLEGWLEVVGDPEEAYNTIPLNRFYIRAEAFIDGYEAALKEQLALLSA